MVKRTLRGDNEAYGQLVHIHQARAIAVANYLCSDFEAAQDIAQEAFVQAYQSLNSLRKPAAFGVWLHGIIRNLCRRYLSRRPPPTASLERDPIPEPSQPPDNSIEIISVLQALPREHREILAARYLQELDYKEIAQMLGITVNNVRVRCFRAKQALREPLVGTEVM